MARPTEGKWWARLHFRVFGVWPRRVVAERLAADDARRRARALDDDAAWDAIRESLSDAALGRLKEREAARSTLRRNRGSRDMLT